MSLERFACIGVIIHFLNNKELLVFFTPFSCQNCFPGEGFESFQASRRRVFLRWFVIPCPCFRPFRTCSADAGAIPLFLAMDRVTPYDQFVFTSRPDGLLTIPPQVCYRLQVLRRDEGKYIYAGKRTTPGTTPHRLDTNIMSYQQSIILFSFNCSYVSTH